MCSSLFSPPTVKAPPPPAAPAASALGIAPAVSPESRRKRAGMGTQALAVPLRNAPLGGADQTAGGGGLRIPSVGR